MTVHLRSWQCCQVIDCKRPAHLYGLCAAHFYSLSVMERKVLIDCEGTTEPLDTLELLYALPSRPDPKRRAA